MQGFSYSYLMVSGASYEVQAGNLTLDLLLVGTSEEVSPIPRSLLALCCPRHLLLPWVCGKPQPVLSPSLPPDPSPEASLFKAKSPARADWHGLCDVMGQSVRHTKGKLARLRVLNGHLTPLMEKSGHCLCFLTLEMDENGCVSVRHLLMPSLKMLTEYWA